MTSQQPFNIFRIFEKDDKEVIHSAFLAFLLEEFPALYQDFLGLPSKDYQAPVLEKRHKGGRTDLLISNKKGQRRILIENKFRSFPYEQQLINYNDAYPDVPHKFVICYAAEYFNFSYLHWKTVDYRKLVQIIKRYPRPKDPMKDLCIKHYCELLTAEYSTDYNDSKHLQEIFSAQAENRFWVQLFYSSLPAELNKFFTKRGIAVDYDINRGGTIIPYINVRPKHWYYQDRELVIQIHNKQIKFYLHFNKVNRKAPLRSEERTVAIELVKHAKASASQLPGMKPKPLQEEFNYNSCFIVQKKNQSLQSIGSNLHVTMAKEIIDFYVTIEQVFGGKFTEKT